jgi:hypothetical protein
MPLFSRKTLVCAKVEAVSGTPESPVGADAVLISNVTLTPIDLMAVDRDLVRPYFGNSPQLVVGQKVVLAFECEIGGANGASATIAPQFDDLLQGCGFSSTGVSTTHRAYSPVSTGFKSITLDCYIDGVRHRTAGAMGNVEFNLPAEGRPTMKFTFTGFYTSIVDTVNLTPDFTGWAVPLGVNNANTSNFSLHGYNGIMSALSINMNNQVVYHSFPGSGGEFVAITDRKPSGQITMQAVTLATKDWFTTAKNMTLGTLAITQGTTALNKFQIICGSTVQIIKPTYTDLDGVRMIQMDLGFIPTSAGNDELEIRTL